LTTEKKPRSTRKKRPANVSKMELFDKAMQLAEQLKSGEMKVERRPRRLMELGLEEEVAGMLLNDWSLRSITARLKRQYGVEISISTISRFDQLVVQPVLGISKKKRERIEQVLATVDVLSEMGALVRQAVDACVDVREIESKMNMPLEIGNDARKQLKEILLAYHEIQNEELGLTGKALVQMNQFNQTNVMSGGLDALQEQARQVIDLDDRDIDRALAAVRGKGTTGD